MNIADVTLMISAAGGMIVAIAAARGAVKSARKAVTDTTITTWQGLAAEYKSERDVLRVELQECRKQNESLRMRLLPP